MRPKKLKTKKKIQVLSKQQCKSYQTALKSYLNKKKIFFAEFFFYSFQKRKKISNINIITKLFSFHFSWYHSSERFTDLATRYNLTDHIHRCGIRRKKK